MITLYLLFDSYLLKVLYFLTVCFQTRLIIDILVFPGFVLIFFLGILSTLLILFFLAKFFKVNLLFGFPFFIKNGGFGEDEEKNQKIKGARNCHLSIFDGFPMMIWCSGINLKFDYFNDTWLNFRGKELSHELGDGWRTGVHPDDVEGFLQTFYDAFFAQLPFETMCRAQRHDGEYRYLVVSGKPMQDKGGVFLGYIIVFQDFTEQRRLEDRLKIEREKALESEMLKTAFLANISHEVRTPMNAIMGFSDLVDNPGITPDKRDGFSKIIKTNCLELLKTIDDIIDLSKIEARQVKIVVLETDLHQLIPQVISSFERDRELMGRQHVEIFFDCKAFTSEPFLLYIDKTRLSQVLNKLIGNALKFTPCGWIKIGYSLNQDGFLIIYVKDTGIGISREKQQVIFERFRQGEDGLTRKFGGNGIGLTISKSLVELMGGKIWVESELDAGSTFYLSIPYRPVPLNVEKQVGNNTM
jgi:PAS domain S-box-containing protein